MDVFDILSEATTEATAFESHAAKVLPLEERILYLQGLALVMNADSNVHDEEKEYLRILIKSFDMDESILEECIAFSLAPDKDNIQAFFRAFRRKPIAQLFLFDAFVVSRRDGLAHDKKTNVINKMAEHLEIPVGLQIDIYHLFCYIENRDWPETAVYFDSFLLNVEYFKHLLAYYEVDYDELMASTAEMRQGRLLEILAGKSKLDLQWEPVRYDCEKVLPKETSITTDFMNVKQVLMNAEVIVPYLQSRLNRGELRIYQQQVSFTEAAKETEGQFFNLQGTGLSYDEYTEVLSLGSIEGFTVPDNVIESLLVFILPELRVLSKPESIQIILKALCGAEIATASTIDSANGRYNFPDVKKCEEKVFICNNVGFIKKKIFSSGIGVAGAFSAMSEPNSIELELPPLRVLLHEQFHLMR